MSDYSIDDILAELDKKSSKTSDNTSSVQENNRDVDDILSGDFHSKKAESYVGEVTQILNDEEIRAKSAEVKPAPKPQPTKAKENPPAKQEKPKQTSKKPKEEKPVSKKEIQPKRDNQQQKAPVEKPKEKHKPKKTAADIPDFHRTGEIFDSEHSGKATAMEWMAEKQKEKLLLHEKHNSTENTKKQNTPKQANSNIDSKDENKELETVLEETGSFAIVEENVPFAKEKQDETPTENTVQIEKPPRPQLSATGEIRRKERIEKLKAEQLQKDRELENPEDFLDAVNPMEIREKVKAYKEKPKPDMKANINLDTAIMTIPTYSTLYAGDTKGIAGNDLKELAQNSVNTEPAPQDDVKEYKAVSAEKEKRTNTALIEKLNKSLEEKRQSDIAAHRTITLSQVSATPNIPTHGLNINYEKQIIEETGAIPLEDPIIAEKKLNDLSANRKHKIRDFVLEDADEEEIDEDEDDEETEFDDYDSTGQIWADLCASHKGLKVRFILLFLITAFTVVVAVLNDFKIDVVFDFFGTRIAVLDRKYDVNSFIYFNMIAGVLGFALCSSVISNGITKLFSLKADSDSICAISASLAIIGGVVNLVNPNDVQLNHSYIYISVALLALLFNTIGKLCMIVRAKRNFRFISGDSQKYYACVIDDENAASIFTKGVINQVPFLVTMRKTEFLSDFLKSSYCDDKADRLSRKLTPIAILIAVVLGVFAYFNPMNDTSIGMNNNIYWAVTVATAILAIMSPFSMMLVVNNPLNRASKSLCKTNSTVLGYSAAEQFSQTNSVIVNANVLFPAGSITLKNLKRCQKKNAVNNILIDEAILLAASLAIHSDSIMSYMFYDVIGGDKGLLSKVENCIYEDNLGISGWIGSRRMMLGNRDQMKNHHIEVPDAKKERKYCGDSSEIVYLAVGGETVAMFIVEMIANNEIKSYIQALEKKGISIIVKTNDSLVTVQKLAELYEVEPDTLKILTHSAHEKFDEYTKYTSRGNGSISCNGTFTSFAQAILAAKTLIKDISLSSMLMLQTIALGVVLALVFTIFGFYQQLTPTHIIAYNMLSTILILVTQSFRKY